MMGGRCRRCPPAPRSPPEPSPSPWCGGAGMPGPRGGPHRPLSSSCRGSGAAAVTSDPRSGDGFCGLNTERGRGTLRTSPSRSPLSGFKPRCLHLDTQGKIEPGRSFRGAPKPLALHPPSWERQFISTVYNLYTLNLIVHLITIDICTT